MIVGLRAVVVLALTAVSLVLFGWQLLNESALAFARTNTLHAVERGMLLGALVTTFVGVVTVGGTYVGARAPAGSVSLQRAARIGAPLLVLCFVPALMTRGLWDPLATGLAIGAFVLIFEPLLATSFAAMSGNCTTSMATPRWSSRRERIICIAIVLLGAALYAAYMSRYTIFSHRRFGTYGYDLGQYDNVFWTTLHGHPMRCAPLGLIHDWQDVGNHADLSVFFFLPFYAIRPNAETLLIIQATMLGLGAIPIYLFAARRLPARYAAGIAACYLFFPPIHGANFYDFHFQPLASTVVLFTIYFIDTRRWIPAVIGFVVALGCREDTSIGLCMLGLYLLLSGYRPRAGAAMAATAAAYFVTIKFVIMPHFWSTWFSDMYKNLYPQPDGPHSFAGVIETLATNPLHVFHTFLTADKLRYFLQIFAPLAFLPLRRAAFLPAIAPGAMFTLLTTEYPPTIDIGFQYSCHYVAYIFSASSLVLSQYRWSASPGRLPSALIALVAGTVLSTTQWGAFPPRGTIRGGFADVGFAHPTATDEQKARDLAELFAMIPADATFSVSEEELPHVSGHLNVYSLKMGTNNADYLLYGTTSYGASAAMVAVQGGGYEELARKPGLVLAKRRAQ